MGSESHAASATRQSSQNADPDADYHVHFWSQLLLGLDDLAQPGLERLRPRVSTHRTLNDHTRTNHQ